MRLFFIIVLVLILCFALAVTACAASEDYLSDSDDSILTTVLVSVGIGILLALLIPMSILKGELKSVRRENAAANYVRDNSMNLTTKRDIFLYRNVVRTPIPKANQKK